MLSVAIFSKHSSSILVKLKTLLPSVQFIEVLSSDPSPLKTVDIILGDYNLVGPHLYNLTNLKWFQGTWAGLDALWPHINKDQLPKFPITRTSGDNFGQLMSEYVVGNIVFWERNFFKVKDNQKNKLWDPSACEYNHRTIADLTVGILGIGSIGNLIGKTLKNLGATVYGYGRREAIDLDSEEFKHVTKYFSEPNLIKLLSNVDYIINVLPNTETTRNLLGNGILLNCKVLLKGGLRILRVKKKPLNPQKLTISEKSSILINIGRGSIIREYELIQALKDKWIAGAILDVFETEPLPPDSELWNFSNVFITPHISGNSRIEDIVVKFNENFQRFSKNEPLLNKVDFIKGY